MFAEDDAAASPETAERTPIVELSEASVAFCRLLLLLLILPAETPDLLARGARLIFRLRESVCVVECL